jgi:mannose-6-phosphate isomerase-like protein (cupin superfamily)
MLIKNLKNCQYFLVPDRNILCELLHPKNEDVDLGCSIAHAYLKPGDASLPHRLKASTEIYYILEGRGRMHIEDHSAQVEPGQAVYIPPGAKQWVENTGSGDLKFLVVVTPPWSDEDEEMCD